MSDAAVKRKLTAVLYADVVGFSRLTGLDEESTHRTVMDVLDFTHNAIEEAGGTVLRYAGDAILAEFASASKPQYSFRVNWPNAARISPKIGVH